MLIKSLSLKNFQCYAGEHEDNSFEFGEGLNLIVGTNGQGKSKIFDAFYWVLHDEVFDSIEREFRSTRLVKDLLISDKAKKNCSVGKKVRTEVTIVCKGRTEREYKLTRVFEAERNEDGAWNCDSGSKLLVSELKGVSWKPIEAARHDTILQMVIPGHLKPYMWFQGEAVHKLMDFSSTSTLTNAIQLLSNLRDYDKIIDLLREERDKAKKKLQTAQKKASKDEQASRKIEVERKELEKKLKRGNLELETAKENLQLADDHLRSIISSVGDAQNRSKDKDNLAKIEQRISTNTSRREQLQSSFTKNLFNDYWILMNAKPSLAKYGEAFGKYIEEHQATITASKNEAVKLPINVPQPVYLQQMIEKEHCFVCDREAKKDSEAHNHMKMMLDRNSDPEPKNIFKNDQSGFLKKLYENQMGFSKVIDGTRDRVAGAINELDTLKSKINEDASEKRRLEEKFETTLANDDSDQILRSYHTHNRNKDTHAAEVRTLETNIKTWTDKLALLDQEMKKLAVGDVPSEIELADKVFDDLLAVAENTKELVFEKFVRALEQKSNELFVEMSQGNEAIKGRIEIRANSAGLYIPYLTGSDGNVLHNPNDSNIILQKLALIMSIIGSRGDEVGEIGNYALISDAPTSKMDVEYTMGFYKTVSRQYKQSIIMTFNFSDDDGPILLNDLEVASLHRIKAEFPAGDPNDRTDLSVAVKRVA